MHARRLLSAVAAMASLVLIAVPAAEGASFASVQEGGSCSPVGATGATASGAPMICEPGSDGSDSWQPNGRVVAPPTTTPKPKPTPKPTPTPTPTAKPTPKPTVKPKPKPKPKPIVANHLVTPNKRLTPGAYIAGLTETSLCASGYLKSVHPLWVSTTKKVFSRYHIAWSLHAKYQVDHLISVGVGGSNAITNLWPQPLAGTFGAKAKAKADAKLRILVCSGRSALPDARRAELANWSTAPAKLLLLPKPVVSTPTAPTPTPSPTPTPTTPPVTTTAPVPPTTTPPVVTTTPAPPTHTTPVPRTTFDHGTFVVGVDIAAGTYEESGGALCTWTRYSDGAANTVLATRQSARPIVTISPTDGAFSSNCDGWTVATSPDNGPALAFSDGSYRIGDDMDITPGTYQASGNAAMDVNCDWATFSDLSGSPASQIDSSDEDEATPSLDLYGSVKLVTVYNCGSWEFQG